MAKKPAEPENLVLALLRELRTDVRAESNGLRDEIRELRHEMNGRFEALQKRVDAQREALSTETVMARYTAKGFDTHMTEFDARLRALEAKIG